MSNTVKATIILRNDTAAEWQRKNPILSLGELGAEYDTGLLKMGDGVTSFNDLEYINNKGGGSANADENLVTTVNQKLTVGNYGKSYWTWDRINLQEIEVQETDLSKWPATVQLEIKNHVARWVEPAITYSPLQGVIDNAVLTNASVTLSRDPSSDREAATRRFVMSQIAAAIGNAPHLKREIVNSIEATDVPYPDENTIYMVQDANTEGLDQYKEYMYIDNSWVMIGDSSAILSNYIKVPENYTPGNSLTLNQDGTLADSGYSAQPPALNVATYQILGGVKSSTANNFVRVDQDGYMHLNQVSTDLLYVPTGSVFVLNGGNAST